MFASAQHLEESQLLSFEESLIYRSTLTRLLFWGYELTTSSQNDHCTTPLGLETIFSPAPQGRSLALQPGAMRRNPVGIQELSINSLLHMVGFSPFWETRIISRRQGFLGSRCCGSARGCRGLAFAGILCRRAWMGSVMNGEWGQSLVNGVSPWKRVFFDEQIHKLCYLLQKYCPRHLINSSDSILQASFWAFQLISWVAIVTRS